MADENVGVTPPDGTTLAGKVRVLLGDTAPRPLEAPVTGLGQYAWFSDDELTILGGMNGDNPKRVAIWVLSQVSMSNALLLKKWTSEDLQVDGPAITRSMELTLKRLSAEVDDEADRSGGDESLDVYGGYTTLYGSETVSGWGWC